MKILQQYSHMNGYEFLIVHKKELWDNVISVINSIDGEKCLTKVSKEKKMKDKMLISPKDLNAKFKEKFNKLGWSEKRISYYVSENVDLIRKTISLPSEQQKDIIQEKGFSAIYSYNQTDFVKNKVAVEVQFGKYAFVAYDLFVKHLAFYVQEEIDVGIEILPMKSMQVKMSSGIGYYEGELYNILRHGRNTPAVPLVLLGVDI